MLVNMFEKLLNRFGYHQKGKDYTQSYIQDLEKENLSLRARLEAVSGLELPFIAVDVEDPIPQDLEKRRQFVALVAGFHNDVLKNKLMKLIADVRSQLSRLDSTIDGQGRKITQYDPKDFDLILKGTENALWLIHDWGESMIAEQLQMQTEITQDERDDLEKIIQT